MVPALKRNYTATEKAMSCSPNTDDFEVQAALQSAVEYDCSIAQPRMVH